MFEPLINAGVGVSDLADAKTGKHQLALTLQQRPEAWPGMCLKSPAPSSLDLEHLSRQNFPTSPQLQRIDSFGRTRADRDDRLAADRQRPLRPSL